METHGGEIFCVAEGKCHSINYENVNNSLLPGYSKSNTNSLYFITERKV
jgi:hypothetical protein